MEITDWSKIWAKINEMSKRHKAGLTTENDPFDCDSCKKKVLLKDLLFCQCQDLICKLCKDGEGHKNHQTLGEYYESQGIFEREK